MVKVILHKVRGLEVGGTYTPYGPGECDIPNKLLEALQRVDPLCVEVIGEPQGDENPLPADLPARDELFAAGFTMLDAVAMVEDLTTVKGIGDATAQKVTDYLGS